MKKFKSLLVQLDAHVRIYLCLSPMIVLILGYISFRCIERAETALNPYMWLSFALVPFITGVFYVKWINDEVQNVTRFNRIGIRLDNLY